MATPKERYITEPTQLQESDLAVELSNLDLAQNPHDSDETTQRAVPQLRLALLQPLADPAMFAACRNPASKIRRSPDGWASNTIGPEYLDISALDKAWRQALARAPPASHITFDLSLPKPVDDSEAPHKIHWDTTTPLTEQDAAVLARDVMRLVAAIATVTRMRAQGDVHFGLSYDEADGVSTRGMGLLSKQLSDIAKASGALHTGIVETLEHDANNVSSDVASDNGNTASGRAQQIEEAA